MKKMRLDQHHILFVSKYIEFSSSLFDVSSINKANQRDLIVLRRTIMLVAILLSLSLSGVVLYVQYTGKTSRFHIIQERTVLYFLRDEKKLNERQRRELSLNDQTPRKDDGSFNQTRMCEHRVKVITMNMEYIFKHRLFEIRIHIQNDSMVQFHLI
jgi:hypothetical protein